MKSKKKILVLLALLLLLAAYFMSGNREVKPLEEGQEKVISEAGPDLEETREEKVPAKKEEGLEEGQEKEEVSQELEGEKLEEEKKLEKEKLIGQDRDKKQKKDKYLTDPVPEGRPKPKEWQDVKVNRDLEKKAKLSVSCRTILNNMELLDPDKKDMVPEDGVIYGEREVSFNPGESVFDLVLREMKNNKIHMEFSMTPIYNSAYIEGINNIYEFDCGEGSGWMYRVNGWYPNYGLSRYILEEGDQVEMIYTCDLGRDIGGGTSLRGE